MNKNPIGRYLKDSWYLYLIALVSMGISIGLDMCAPLVTKHIIDDVIVDGRTELLTKYLLAFLGIGCKMRKNLFSHVQKLSMGYFDKNNTGELLARMKDDVDRVMDSLGFVGMLIIEGIVHVVCIIVCMVRLSPHLTLIPVVILPVIGCVAVKLERQLSAVYDKISEQNVQLNTVAQENLSGVRTVKSLAQEDYEIEKFTRHNKCYYNLNMEQAKVLIKYDPNISFLTKAMLVLLLLFGGLMVIAGGFSIGSLGAFMEYANSII